MLRDSLTQVVACLNRQPLLPLKIGDVIAIYGGLSRVIGCIWNDGNEPTGYHMSGTPDYLTQKEVDRFATIQTTYTGRRYSEIVDNDPVGVI